MLLVLPHLGAGGTQRVVVNVAGFLRQEGHDVTIAITHSGYPCLFSIPDAVEVVCVDTKSETPPKPSTQFQLNSHVRGLGNRLLKPFSRLTGMRYTRIRGLRETLRTKRPDVVMSFLPSTNLTSVVASYRLPLKLVLNERNDPLRQEISLRVKRNRRVLYRFADAVTLNFVPDDKQAVRKCLGVKDFIFLPNPIAIPNERRRWEPGHAFVFLFVGRLVPQKGIRNLIEAAALLDAQTMSAEWMIRIVGSGPEASDLHSLTTALGLDNRIRFDDHQLDIDNVYASSSAFILPSLHEGTPNALLEAMSWGLPSIVADNVPGARNLVRLVDDRLIFEAGSSSSLAGVMELMVIGEIDVDRVADQCREIASAHSWQHVRSHWLRLLGSNEFAQ